MTHPPTVVSLFAGIGGFDLALERAGAKVVAAVEINADARRVLRRRFPDVRVFDDVRTVSGADLRTAGFVPERGIVTGGFPCQDLSVAGKRAGLTPLECERLQGFPDGWTEGQRDGVRYAQLGNAVAVPVAEWIARRLLAEMG